MKWKDIIPSAVSCLERSINACLTFFSFPEEEWISLRTTNIIERLNKEFKRRTKPIEILAGEPGLRDIRPQIPGLRIPGYRYPLADPALRPAPAQPDIHGGYPGKTACDRGGFQKSPGHGDQE